MAKFYPNISSDFNGSQAEERIYKTLQSLPERVRIFHSYQWSTQIHHKYRKDGEADFVIYDPQYGILVIEVKGGGIFHKEGLWWQKDSNSTRQLQKSPWDQASSSAYFLINHLRNSSLEAKIPIHSCIWFTDTEVKNNTRWPVNIPQFAILGREDLDSDLAILQTLENVWNSYKKDYNFPLFVPQGFNEKIVDILLPTFNLVATRNWSAEESESIFYRLTKDQFKILEFIEDQKKVAIGGGAGSGKTMIAKEQALQLASNGEKTLFLVFNSALADELNQSLKHENLEITTWGKLAYSHSERNSPDIMSEELVKKISDEDYELPFKNIVIDEGQDFQESWIQALDWTTELNQGGMYLFYDNRQKIQSDEDGIQGWIEKADTKLTINRNCRNTQAIAKTAHAFLGEDCPKMLVELEGKPPLWIEESNDQNDLFHINNILKEKLDENYSPEQITLMTLGALKNSVAHQFKFLEHTLTSKKIKIPIKETREKGSILKTTVRKFKGLEAQIIIILDMQWISGEKWENADEEAKEKIISKQKDQMKELYTAISRSKMEVFLITKTLPKTVFWSQKIYSASEFRKFFAGTYFLNILK